MKHRLTWDISTEELEGKGKMYNRENHINIISIICMLTIKEFHINDAVMARLIFTWENICFDHKKFQVKQVKKPSSYVLLNPHSVSNTSEKVSLCNRFASNYSILFKGRKLQNSGERIFNKHSGNSLFFFISAGHLTTMRN